MSEPTCPSCGNLLSSYGCVDVEQVGAFCRGPVPPRPRTSVLGPPCTCVTHLDKRMDVEDCVQHRHLGTAR